MLHLLFGGVAKMQICKRNRHGALYLQVTLQRHCTPGAQLSSICFLAFAVVQAFVKIKPHSVYRYKKTKSKVCAIKI